MKELLYKNKVTIIIIFLFLIEKATKNKNQALYYIVA